MQVAPDIDSCMAQRANLEAILDSVADAIFAVNHRLQIMNLNQAFSDISGYEPKEVLGQPATEILQAEELRDFLEHMLHASEGVQDRELDVRVQRGKRKTVLLRATPLRDEGRILRGLVIVMRDLTETRQLKRALEERHQFHRIIGKSHQLQEIYELIEDLRDSQATVLVQGESGTGKELVAHAIHYSSSRKEGPFIRVNCAALAENLLESELFGHVRGSFTGALHDKVGRFELADGGTLFLDEIGDLSPDLQMKLLRVLQEREVERVGEAKPRPVNVRVITATHKDLQAAMETRAFREDLYYRLHVVPIHLPPLRERQVDIPLLVEHFVGQFRETTGKNIGEVAPDAMDCFMEYAWPGNIRELENSIEYAFVRCRDTTIQLAHLPLTLRDPKVNDDEKQAKRPEKLGRQELLAALTKAGWNKSKAARSLGVDRTTIWRKAKEYGLTEEMSYAEHDRSTPT